MSLAPLNTLRVTSQTTLDELKAFQEGIGKDEAKLQGTKNKDGSITLKAVDRDGSFLSKMFGISKKRRDTARSAINMVMVNSGAIDRKPTGNLTSLINADRKHSPKSAMLRDLVAFAKADNTDRGQKVTDTTIKPDILAAEVRQRKFPTLEAKGLDTTSVGNMMKLARDFSRDQPLTEARVKEFSGGITKELLQKIGDPSKLTMNERTMLGISDIEGYVKSTFAKSVPPPHNDHFLAAVDMIAKGVAEDLSEKLLGTNYVGEQSVKIGNDTYFKVATLGAGGHGTAMLYRCEETGKEVVLKVPPKIRPELNTVTVETTQFDFKSEIDMHTKLMDGAAQKHPNVLSFEGAVRLPGGQIATLTEVCSGGEMAAVLKKLDQAVTDGSLTPEQAMTCKLTLMRDMVDGQNEICERGFSHRDVKFQNVFVDGKGASKVADFGDSAFSQDFSLANQKLVDNPVFLAPENVAARHKLNRFEASVKEHQIAHKKAKIEIFNALVGPGGAFAHLGQAELSVNVKERNKAPVTVTASSLGTVGVEPDEAAFKDVEFYGGRLFEEFENRIESMGEVGQLLKTVINDLADGEAKRLMSAIDTRKGMLPAATMINGPAADVWSFGAALVESFTQRGDTIAYGGSTDKVERQLVEYFSAKPEVPPEGGNPTPLPKALERGGFLTEKYASKHENGTVSGDPALDDLINQTLQRNPAERPSFAEIRKNPVFNRPGVGDPATRNVIAALIGKPAKSVEDIKSLATNMAA